MPRFLVQREPWAKRNSGDRIPHSDKVDPDDPHRADILITLHRMELEGIEIDQKAVDIAKVLVRRRHAPTDAPPPPRQPDLRSVDATGQKRWVYYVRCGYLIKIGTSANLPGRFQSVRPNEVLALEPGGQELETAMHRKFKPLRAGGDYFHPGPALQAHIAELRERLGPPNWAYSVLKDGHDFYPDNQG
ncbi:hypothetical protein ACIGFK_13245 [Streptomyces sp. NPDC085524]|uniref:hypothetical protein n=1 Tax=Streptomyces sp. NPDC085524 TaxID=3365728 RepID=UPI0037D5E1E0